MDSFTDYYNILGVEVHAPSQAIKSAFKKLALQYHPDVYKGEDAHERMQLLLKAYQTLNDPVARGKYDMLRSEYVQGRPGAARPVVEQKQSTRSTSRSHTEASRGARRDPQRHYDFPSIFEGQPARVDLVDMAYALSSGDAQILMQQGMLRGVAPETSDHAYYCHRCHYRWQPSSSLGGRRNLPRFCPKCLSMDWSEYLLLRCIHCCAVFESEQIRYEIGTYSYGQSESSSNDASGLCPPYELFPLCPYCGTARWCPAEDARVGDLRLRVARRTATTRLIWISVALIIMLLIGVVAFNVLH